MADDDDDVPRRNGRVERAVRHELHSMGVSVQTSALAAAMVELARRMDISRGAAAVAQAALQLRETRRVLLDELGETAAGDVIDDLNIAKATLRVVDGGAAAEDLDGPAVRSERGRPGRPAG